LIDRNFIAFSTEYLFYFRYWISSIPASGFYLLGKNPDSITDTGDCDFKEVKIKVFLSMGILSRYPDYEFKLPLLCFLYRGTFFIRIRAIDTAFAIFRLKHCTTTGTLIKPYSVIIGHGFLLDKTTFRAGNAGGNIDHFCILLQIKKACPDSKCTLIKGEGLWCSPNQKKRQNWRFFY